MCTAGRDGGARPLPSAIPLVLQALSPTSTITLLWCFLRGNRVKIKSLCHTRKSFQTRFCSHFSLNFPCYYTSVTTLYPSKTPLNYEIKYFHSDICEFVKFAILIILMCYHSVPFSSLPPSVSPADNSKTLMHAGAMRSHMSVFNMFYIYCMGTLSEGIAYCTNPGKMYGWVYSSWQGLMSFVRLQAQQRF